MKIAGLSVDPWGTKRPASKEPNGQPSQAEIRAKVAMEKAKVGTAARKLQAARRK